MKKPFFALVVLFASLLSAVAQFNDPFTVDVQDAEDGFVLSVDIPEGHFLYADAFSVSDVRGDLMALGDMPDPSVFVDPETGHEKAVYAESFDASFHWSGVSDAAGKVTVAYQGCNESVCFMPQSKVFNLSSKAGNDEIEEVAAERQEDAASVEETAGWKDEVLQFEVKGSAVGYMGAESFISFLDQAEAGGEISNPSAFHLFLNDPVAFVREKGVFATLLLILVGGVLLNLTPCVLPMIPVNLAVIGAGAQAGSKGRGFALGATYGLGMALAYGILGVVVVLTGSRFGTIQSTPWFNLGIAVIFVVLALAMFDVIHIDFSRFQGRLGAGKPEKSGSFPLALMMGAVAALLAGACVAPVVIAVLILAANVHKACNCGGLFLPFVLGIGMALPWPFAGAGLSFLPKPGKWMVWVKHAFGVGIILFALYYGRLSYQLFHSVEIAEMHDEGHLIVNGDTNEGLAEALKAAADEGRPVFIDFWASSCKNCKKMDRDTFKDEMVRARLSDYVFIKYVANELTGSPSTKAVMDYFDVQGLPTFIVLAQKEDVN